MFATSILFSASKKTCEFRPPTQTRPATIGENRSRNRDPKPEFEDLMKFKTLIVTLLFAISMWAQTAAPSAPEKPGDNRTKAACCKDGAACCKKGVACCMSIASASCCKTGAACCKEGAGCCAKQTADKAGCCKEGSECCKAGAACCANMAKATEGKDCCGGKMCKRHKADKA